MKKLLLLLCTIASVLVFSSCNKSQEDQRITYIFDSSSVIGAGRTGELDKLSMVSEVSAIVGNVDNTYVSRQAGMVKEIDAVVAKYNNSTLSGTAILYGSLKQGDSHTVKTWTFTPQAK